ncbi:uncharacterized protein LOC128746001 [Sabethes cyaneus]|uniref:uncharacterized protein LOC128746001 n=1 Tax=Sabethes cyaneus TaxID=53552 RepID=UPI00237EB1A4|nr:uncharacterized protein LOC128746001 [Sabethes cyaneus]
MDDSSPLFENIFLYSDYDPTKLEDLLDSGAIKCFPPADRRHKYEWAGGFNQKHFLDELNNSDNDSNMDNSLEDKPLAIKQLVKKNEKQKTLEHVCACQTKHELVDLGDWHFPRYIVNARCQNRNLNSQKCFRKLRCKEIPYKIRVLTKRFDSGISDNDLPEPLRDIWRFESVTIAAACQCSV